MGNRKGRFINRKDKEVVMDMCEGFCKISIFRFSGNHDCWLVELISMFQFGCFNIHYTYM